MRYLSIDTETTGLDRERHQVLEIGAIVEDTNNILEFEYIPKINIILHYDEFVGSAYALGLNSRIFDILKDYEKIKGNAQKVLEFQREVGSKIVSYYDAYTYLYVFLENNYLTPEEEKNDKKEVIQNKWQPIHITAAGKNVAGFDIPFLMNLPKFREVFRFRSRCIDPGNYMVLPEDEEMPSSDLCKQRAGLGEAVSHKALEDAWDMIQILRFGAKGKLYPE